MIRFKLNINSGENYPRMFHNKNNYYEPVGKPKNKIFQIGMFQDVKIILEYF